MSLFCDPQDEEKLYQVLRAYCQEWGKNAVIISLPASWKRFVEIGVPARFRFTTVNTIVLSVECESDLVRYEVQLLAE